MKKKFFIILILILSMNLSKNLKVCAMDKDSRITIEPDGTKVINIKSSDIESIKLVYEDKGKIKEKEIIYRDKNKSKDEDKEKNLKNKPLINKPLKKPEVAIPPLNLDSKDDKNSNKSLTNEELMLGLTKEEIEYNKSFFNKDETSNETKRNTVKINGVLNDSVKNKIGVNENNEEISLYEMVYNYLELEYKGFIKNSKISSREAKERFLKALNFRILDFKRTLNLVNDTLNDVIKTKNKYSPEKEYNYFGKEKMKGMFKRLVKTIVKNANLLNIYEAVNQEEKIGLSEYVELSQDNMLEKYKNKIFFNIEKLKLTVEQQLNFWFEIQEVCNFLIQYYKDFFYYKKVLKSYEEEGYKIKDLVKKIKNNFVIYENEETKINVIYADKGKKLKHFIYFKNPAESVMKEIEKLKKNINNNSVEIYKDAYGGIRIVYDDVNKDFLRKIYPCVKQQYYENSKNILFFIKDVTINFTPKSDDAFDEDLKRCNMLKILKENMFSKLYNDEYELKIDEDDEEKDFKSKETKKEILFNLKEIKDKDIFYNKEENFKYVAKVKYYLDCLARFKDIFNMNSDFVKEKFSDLLNSFGFYDFLVKPQNYEDYFEVKLCGYEDFFENKKDLINRVNKFMNEFSEKLIEETNAYCYNKLYDSNNTIRLYRSYLNDEEKLEKYFSERDYKGKFTDNELYTAKNAISGFAKQNNGRNAEKTIISASVVPIDWSEKYRGNIPFMDLIIKSFYKYGEPFSNKVIDVNSPFIEDYLLRVLENLVDGIDVFKKTLKENMESVEILKNLNY